MRAPCLVPCAPALGEARGRHQGLRIVNRAKSALRLNAPGAMTCKLEKFQDCSRNLAGFELMVKVKVWSVELVAAVPMVSQLLVCQLNAWTVALVAMTLDSSKV